jgi:hypothetical protein
VDAADAAIGQAFELYWFLELIFLDPFRITVQSGTIRKNLAEI